MTSRYFNKEYNVRGKQGEEDVIREAYYNKFGQVVHHDVGNFNKLIHVEQEEEVASMMSEAGPKKT